MGETARISFQFGEVEAKVGGSTDHSIDRKALSMDQNGTHYHALTLWVSILGVLVPVSDSLRAEGNTRIAQGIFQVVVVAISVCVFVALTRFVKESEGFSWTLTTVVLATVAFAAFQGIADINRPKLSEGGRTSPDSRTVSKRKPMPLPHRTRTPLKDREDVALPDSNSPIPQNMLSGFLLVLQTCFYWVPGDYVNCSFEASNENERQQTLCLLTGGLGASLLYYDTPAGLHYIDRVWFGDTPTDAADGRACRTFQPAEKGDIVVRFNDLDQREAAGSTATLEIRSPVQDTAVYAQSAYAISFSDIAIEIRNY